MQNRVLQAMRMADNITAPGPALERVRWRNTPPNAKLWGTPTATESIDRRRRPSEVVPLRAASATRSSLVAAGIRRLCIERGPPAAARDRRADRGPNSDKYEPMPVVLPISSIGAPCQSGAFPEGLSGARILNGNFSLKGWLVERQLTVAKPADTLCRADSLGVTAVKVC